MHWDSRVRINLKNFVFLLQTAVGAAMKCFDKCRGINVPRSRFLPVKKTSDLLLIMSNLYQLTDGTLLMSANRMFLTTPLIKLGDENFKNVSLLFQINLDFTGGTVGATSLRMVFGFYERLFTGGGGGWGVGVGGCF